jgi:ABC-type branched-subunit amino acid transport system substrate-binding protein
MLRIAAGVVAGAALVAGCASSSDGGAAAPKDATPTATGPAPGVTVDTAALKKVGLDYNLGDHRAVYKALFDDINAKGGIHGRKIEPIIAPVDPTSVAGAESACLKLTEDDDVFVATGFFLGDAVLCTVDTHATAVIGGTLTAERAARAKAPWFGWYPDDEQQLTSIRAFESAGELKGRVAVYTSSLEQPAVRSQVIPLLQKLGVKPVEVAYGAAPTNDTTALRDELTTISQKFQSAKADAVLLYGAAAAGNWLQYASDRPYQPKLLGTDISGARSYATNAATKSTAVLSKGLFGGPYGPDNDRFSEPAMQACLKVLKKAGMTVPEPNPKASAKDQPHQAAFQACPDVALIRALFEKAGRKLNYGTLKAAGNGLKVHIPGEPDTRTYGPSPKADGDPKAYLFHWDETKKDFVREDS